MTVRIIPRLDIKGPNLVKGIHLEGLRVVGKPEGFARYYYENGADELIYMDAVASLYGRNSLLEIVNKTSREIFIPLTVGGGLRTVEDIRSVLRAGADKVSINTAAIQNPQLIRDASRAFGSSTIVVSIDAMKTLDGGYECFTDYGRERSGLDAFEWASRAEELGAGELVVTSINREGTGKGFDLELTRMISEKVSIPVIASGGAGNAQHILEVIRDGRADAVSLASMLHYALVENMDPDHMEFQTEGNIEFLAGKRDTKQFTTVNRGTLPEIKEFLTGHGISCRYSFPQPAVG
jgi:cyclase